jgi:hypothetical protein
VQDIACLILVPPAQELDLDPERLEGLARLNDLSLQTSVCECERSKVVEEDFHKRINAIRETAFRWPL